MQALPDREVRAEEADPNEPPVHPPLHLGPGGHPSRNTGQYFYFSPSTAAHPSPVYIAEKKKSSLLGQDHKCWLKN